MACIFAPASGCSSARLEYTSGGRVVVGSNPIIPTNRFQVLVLLGLFLWVKIAVSKSRRSSSVALENILIAFASLGDRLRPPPEALEGEGRFSYVVPSRASGTGIARSLRSSKGKGAFFMWCLREPQAPPPVGGRMKK